jgi:CRISPR/Cas system-associated endonuclease/helicase Cas3
MDGQTESGWLHFHSQFISSDRDEVMREIREFGNE